MATDTIYTPIEVKDKDIFYFMIKQYVIGNSFEAKKRIKQMRITTPTHKFKRQYGTITEYKPE